MTRRDRDSARITELEALRFVANFSEDPVARADAEARFDAAEYHRLLDETDAGWT